MAADGAKSEKHCNCRSARDRKPTHRRAIAQARADGLFDEPRSGAPSTISQDDPPDARDYATDWTLRSLTKTVWLASSAIRRVIKAVISLVWYAAYQLYEVFGIARENRARLIILYFHAVRVEDIPVFRRQLEAIKTYAEVVDADYVGKPDGRPKVAITFNDAFMSMVDNALPELIAREMPYTIFVPTGYLGRNPGWQMERATLDRHEIVANGDTLRALVSMGARIGAHSRFHPKLTLIGPNEAQAEITELKAELECLLGRTVELFAFPYGDFNREVLHFCEEAGYRFVYSIGPGSVDPTDTTMLRPRVAVKLSDTRIEFWLKLRGGYEWMQFTSAMRRRFGGTYSALLSAASGISVEAAASTPVPSTVLTSLGFLKTRRLAPTIICKDRQLLGELSRVPVWFFDKGDHDWGQIHLA